MSMSIFFFGLENNHSHGDKVMKSTRTRDYRFNHAVVIQKIRPWKRTKQFRFRL